MGLFNLLKGTRVTVPPSMLEARCEQLERSLENTGAILDSVRRGADELRKALKDKNALVDKLTADAIREVKRANAADARAAEMRASEEEYAALNFKQAGTIAKLTKAVKRLRKRCTEMHGELQTREAAAEELVPTGVQVARAYLKGQDAYREGKPRYVKAHTKMLTWDEVLYNIGWSAAEAKSKAATYEAGDGLTYDDAVRDYLAGFNEERVPKGVHVCSSRWVSYWAGRDMRKLQRRADAARNRVEALRRAVDLGGEKE